MTKVNPPKPDDDAVTELAVEQARAALALSAAEMGEFEWDLAKDIFVVSERMAAICGMPAGQWPGRGGEYPLDVVHPDDRDSLRVLLTDKLTNEFRYTAQYRMVRPDDRRLQWMESSAVILRGPGRRAGEADRGGPRYFGAQGRGGRTRGAGGRTRPSGHERTGVGAVPGGAVGAQDRVSGRLS